MICKFNKAQYLINEPVYIDVPNKKNLDVKIFNLEEEVFCKINNTSKGIKLSGLPIGNYGISICSNSLFWQGAFDVVKDKSSVVRYGFLTDFSSRDLDSNDIEWMKDLHINAIQFYDWMYCHDHLLPLKEKYDDPLGRHLDINSIKMKINSSRKYGIRPFAYGAIYAASKDMFFKHPSWAMYTMDKKPIIFANWLYYMNITNNCGWSNHIINEYKKVIRFGFSGIHMDTYGFPKKVWDYKGKPIELDKEFIKLINKARKVVKYENNNNGVIFNAVNNWPMEKVANSKQDNMYIEVWPPHDTYYDLYTLIREARIYSNKNVILAAYMKPFQKKNVKKAENSLLLTLATISASGGTQLVFGENKSVLMDSYYVNYAKLSKSILPIVQKYCDFIVRYGDLLYNDKGIDITRTASGGINEDIYFKSKEHKFSVDAKSNTIWTIVRETNKKITINLINICGNDNLWDEGKNKPTNTGKIQIKIRLDRFVKGFYLASPDFPSLDAYELKYTYKTTNQGRVYTIDIPSIKYWSVIWVKL